MAATEDMYMQMRHTLPAVRAIVDHYPVTFRQFQFLRHTGGNQQQVTQQVLVLGLRFCFVFFFFTSWSATNSG